MLATMFVLAVCLVEWKESCPLICLYGLQSAADETTRNEIVGILCFLLFVCETVSEEMRTP